jgi:hypothetical protein
MEGKFAFQLNDRVALVHSGENGVVIGRVEYLFAENGYLVRYRAGDGRQVENWWGESAIVGRRSPGKKKS